VVNIGIGRGTDRQEERNESEWQGRVKVFRGITRRAAEVARYVLSQRLKCTQGPEFLMLIFIPSFIPMEN